MFFPYYAFAYLPYLRLSREITFFFYMSLTQPKMPNIGTGPPFNWPTTLFPFTIGRILPYIGPYLKMFTFLWIKLTLILPNFHNLVQTHSRQPTRTIIRPGLSVINFHSQMPATPASMKNRINCGIFAYFSIDFSYWETFIRLSQQTNDILIL